MMHTSFSCRLALFLLVIIALSACEPSIETEAELLERALGIHERVITLDTHIDIRTSNFTEESNYTMDLGNQVNLPKMEEGGLDVAWFVVFVGQGELNDEAYAEATESALAKFEAIHWLAEEKAPDRIELAYTSDDVRRIAASGKKVAMIAIENGFSVGTDIGNVKRFQELGGRYMSMSHNGHSQLSDSNTGERDSTWQDSGLTDLGRQVIAEMNKWGIMVDLSHPSKQANLQAMELSRAPVIASHSAARALNNHSRNLDDEQLMALKDNGGVIQTVAFRGYVNAEKNNAARQAVNAIRSEISEEMGVEIVGRREQFQMSQEDRQAYRERVAPVEEAVQIRLVDSEIEGVNVADFVDHIDYLVDLIGLDHVGISSDFDGGGGVDGWNSAAETFNVTIELVRRGYNEEEIGKLWSGNLLRVLDEVQRIAMEIQAEG